MKKMAIYVFLGTINLFMWLAIVLTTLKTIYITFSYLTILSFSLSTFYFLTLMVFEIRFFILKKNKLLQEDHLNHKFFIFTKDRLAKFAFTASTTVCITYWSMVLAGDIIMNMDHDSNPIFVNIYIHFIIAVQLLCEVIFSNRNYSKQLYHKDLAIVFFIVGFYSITLTTLAKTLDYNIYPFLKLEIIHIILVNSLIALLAFNMYQLYHFIIEKKVKKRPRSFLKIISKEEEYINN
jgi:hypothetical protein